ncbi:MAG: methyltransferase [Selenomonadaceae bacterium]|nr:methyltransferase [Selenomonadaceae bacterium]
MNDFDQIDRRGLLQFISPNVENISVLVIESLSYLNEIRDLLPSANILVLTQDHFAKSDYAHLNCDWIFDDYRNLNFTIEENIFDIIISEDCLTLAYDTYKTIFAINRMLKGTGFLVTQFENIRFIGILESLKQGYFAERERHLYAKTEIVRLLNDALFKEINFAPYEIFDFDVDEWINFGFDNFVDDLNVKTWIVRADRSTAEVAALKRFYTPQIRKQLATLIHRIEYDIDREENILLLKNFCEENQIFDDYLNDFIDQIVLHRERFNDL